MWLSKIKDIDLFYIFNSLLLIIKLIILNNYNFKYFNFNYFKLNISNKD